MVVSCSEVDDEVADEGTEESEGGKEEKHRLPFDPTLLSPSRLTELVSVAPRTLVAWVAQLPTKFDAGATAGKVVDCPTPLLNSGGGHR
jgi:hypothetical protein